MARVSLKRKAKTDANRQKALKRWKNEEPSASPPPLQSTQFSTPHGKHVSAASYRHSLLPQDEETYEKSDDSALLVISLLRLQALISLVRCDCGKEVTSDIITEYFDCTIHLTCDQCNKVVHHCEAKKCQNSDLTQGNVVHVYYSVSEGYGRAGLSRLTAI